MRTFTRNTVGQVACLALLLWTPLAAEEDPAFSIDWLIGSSTKAGIYEVAAVQVGVSSGHNGYTARIVKGGRLAGQLPGTVVIQGGRRNVHPRTATHDHILVLFDGGGVRRTINLTSPVARGLWGAVITRDFEVLNTREEIVAKVEDLLESQPRFKTVHPTGALEKSSQYYTIVEIPAGKPAHALFQAASTPRLVVPTDPSTWREEAGDTTETVDSSVTVANADTTDSMIDTAGSMIDTTGTVIETTTTEVETPVPAEARKSEGMSSLVLFGIGLVVAAFIALYRARTRT